MSHELILNPKARLEAVLKLEELKHDNSTRKSDEIECKQNKIRKDDRMVVEKPEEIKVKKDEPHTKEVTPIKNQRKIKSKNTIQQKGGKSYIVMSPKQFMNVENRKLTLKEKWLSFSI